MVYQVDSTTFNIEGNGVEKLESTTYTKEARTTMKTDRQGYISELVNNYKKFKRNLVI